MRSLIIYYSFTNNTEKGISEIKEFDIQMHKVGDSAFVEKKILDLGI